MCRYAFTTYKHHFVCFTCRKGFKKAPIEDVMRQHGRARVYSDLRDAWQGNRAQLEQRYGATYRELIDEYLVLMDTCPQCAGHMQPMGLDFRVPAQGDVNRWEIVRFLVEHGFTFAGCGCSVGYEPPERMSELPQWLKQHHRCTEPERLLREFAVRSG